MNKIIVVFIDGTEKTFMGNYTLEGAFIRINHDHDLDKKTPNHTTVYPYTQIKSVESIVNQNKPV